MPVSVGELIAKLKLDSSGFSSGMKAAEKQAHDFGSGLGGVRAKLDGIAGQFSVVGAAAAASFSAIGAAAIKTGFDFLALKEQATIAFTNLLGSGEKAQAFLAQLADFAARTPFEFPDLLRASQRFMAMGFSAGQVIPILTAVGDAVAAMGGNAETIDRVTTALVQMQAKGKVSAEEMMQLAEAGVNGWQILADTLGITVPQAMERGKKGLLDGKEAVAILVKGLEEGTKNTKAFGGMMEQQSKTFQGVMSTIKDTGTQVLGEILLPLFTKVRDGLLALTKVLPDVQKWFTSLSPEVKNLALTLGVMGTALPAVLLGISGLAALFSALLSPVGLVVIAVGGLAAAFATNFGGIRDTVSSWVADAKAYYEHHKEDIDNMVAKVKEAFGTYIQELGKAASDLVKLLNDMKRAIDGFSAENDGSWKFIVSVIRTQVDAINVTVRAFVALLRTQVDILRAAWALLETIIIEPIKKALEWIERNASRFQAAFSAITAAAKIGLQVHSPPQAAKWLMEIGKASEDEAKRVKASGNLWQEGFSLITKYAAEMHRGLQLTEKVWRSLAPFIQESLIKQAKAYQENAEATAKWQAVAIAALGNIKKSVESITPVLATLSTAIRGSAEGVGPAFDYLMDASDEATKVLVRDAEIRRQRIAESNKRIADDFHNLVDVFKDLSNQLPSSWNKVIDGILTASGRVGEGLVKLGIKVKGWAADIVGVIGTLPGKFGDAARGVLRTVDQWVAFFDKILALLHRFNQKIPESIESAISKIGSLFKHTQSAISGYVEKIPGSAGIVTKALDEMGFAAAKDAGKLADAANSSQSSANKVVSALGTITAGIATFMGTRGQGKLVGVLGGALAGAQIGAMFGGLGAAIGAGVGAIAGLFGSGKSAAQREQERLQLERLKIDVQQSAQAVINAALEGFNKALDFLERLDDFTPARRKAFTRFFNQLSLLMDYFKELAGKWSQESLAKAKALAEAIGPVSEAVGGAVQALDAMNLFIAPAQRTIDKFFSSLTDVFNRFAELSESVANGIQKRARKFAERLLPVVGVIKEGVEGLTAILTFKEIPVQTLDAFGASLKMAVVKIGEIADSVDIKMAKVAARFAERAGVVSDLLKSGTEGLAAVATLGAVPAAAFDAFASGIEIAVTRLAELGDKLEDEALGRAVAVANAITPIANGLKVWVEAAGAAKDYAQVAASTWDAIVNDFDRAVALMDMMLASAIDFLPRALKFEDVMKQIAEAMKASLAYAGEAVSSAASAFGGVVGALSGGPSGGTFPGGEGSFAAAAFAPSSFAPMAAKSPSVPSGPTTVINVGGVAVSADDPRGRALLIALADLLGVGGGLDQVISQHG